MFHAARSVGMLGAALLCAAYASATTVTVYEGTNYPTVYNQWAATLLSPGASGDVLMNITNGNNASVTTGGFTFTGSPNMQETNQTLLAQSITITPPSGGESAMFLIIGNGNGANATGFNISLSDGESFTAKPLEAFAFTSPAMITTLTISGFPSGDTLDLADFRWGNVQSPGAPVPETGTVTLTCAGLLILLGTGRKLIFRDAI